MKKEKVSFEDFSRIIEVYLSDCRKSNTYLKNFSTFLNNLPDVDSLKNIELSPEELQAKLRELVIKRSQIMKDYPKQPEKRSKVEQEIKILRAKLDTFAENKRPERRF